DLALGLMITVARKISYLDRYTKDGNWRRLDDSSFLGSEVSKKTLGIIGLGRVGRQIAKRAHLGFDMEILYHNRKRDKEAEMSYNALYCSLEELLAKSDYVLMMLPYTEETHH